MEKTRQELSVICRGLEYCMTRPLAERQGRMSDMAGAFAETFEAILKQGQGLGMELEALASLMQLGLSMGLGTVPATDEKLELMLDGLRKVEAKHINDIREVEDMTDFAQKLNAGNVKRVVCMFGYGDGAYVEAVARTLTQDSIFIVYEPMQDDILTFKEELQDNVDFYLQEGMIVCCHPYYDKVFKREYNEFISAIGENRERIMVNKNTLKRFKEDAPRNVIANLPSMLSANLVTELGAILTPDVPVIIVAAGPSLDRNIEELKRAKGHCLIFAVDTAMKYLMERDIIPDLGITIEPIKPMANYADERSFLVPHVFDCESNPEIVRKHRSRKLIYNCRDYVRRVFEGVGKEVPPLLASGGSVATSAFAICYELGIKNIILIGQDLAYSGTATHAGGVESMGINNNVGYEMVDGVNGEKVRTRIDWIGYKRWFENSIRVIDDLKKDMTVIDATEGGALIAGTKLMRLSEAIDTLCITGSGESVCDYDFAEKLKELPTFLSVEELEAAIALVKKSKAELSIVKAAAQEAAKSCRRAVKELELTDATAAFIKKARKTCEGSLLFPLINNYAVSDIADEVSRIRLQTGQRDGGASELRQQELAFEAIARACDYFVGVFAEENI